MSEITSRERMLRTLNRQPVDHIPCCFMSFSALRQRHQEDRYAVVDAELGMGLDSMLFIPTASRGSRPDHPDLRGLPVRLPQDVEVQEWQEETPGEAPILHKVYRTPAGTLSTSVRLSDDWPHGEHIPFIDDYQVPRSLDPLVKGPADLPAVAHLLIPPDPRDVAAFAREAEQARAFAAERGVLVAGGWGVGMDMANWLCGMQSLMVLTLQQPDFVDTLLEMIHQWNVARMKVVLDAPVDLYIRRAWYEGCDFVTPRFYRQAILPRLKAEAELAHAAGARFGYICSSGNAPMLDAYLEAGIDVLLAVDPIQGTRTNMAGLKEKIGHRIALWGGVSGAVTVEMGTELEVREAVRQAISTLGPDGFILSPVDNLTVDAPLTWQNVDVFIDEWRRCREGASAA